MSELLLIALAAAAVLIGITGAWSPCGLSMVETIGPTGHTGGLPTTWAALATFVPGCLIGGAVTFGGLAWAGSLLGEAGDAAYVVAAVIAIAAALAEARGLPIRPQIRRQLPEHWRRLMPMPVAAGLYGALLGLGFTTFVLSFGVWALAGISFALGDPAAGLLVGLGFGAGRALPVLALAPLAGRAAGTRATELMTQNQVLYRGFRAGDAAALGLVAAALLTAGTAAVADRPPGDSYRGKGTPVVSGAGDPGWSGGDLVAQRSHLATAFAQGARALGSGGAILIRDGRRQALGGSIPAVGGPFVALRRGGGVALLDRASLHELARLHAPDTDAIAISRRWLVERVRSTDGDRLQVRAVSRDSSGGTEGEAGGAAAIAVGEPETVARVGAPGQLGRPSLSGDDLVFAASTTRGSRLRHRSLATGGTRTLLSGRRVNFTNPAVFRGRVAYVRTTNERQEIRLRPVDARGPGRVIHYRPATSLRDPDHGHGRHRIPTRDLPPRRDRDPWALWSLALAPKAVYATLTRPNAGGLRSRILRFPR